MTVQEFLLNAWYSQKVAIIDLNQKQLYDALKDEKTLKEISLFFGDNWQTRSDLYKPIKKMEVSDYGVIDNTLVIEVK